LRNQNGPLKLTPAHYQVTAMLALQPTVPPTPGTGFYRRLATRKCGRNVADRSWVVFLQFPEAQTVFAGNGISLFAPTKSGWKLWYRYK
jgi:hypothetical protein